MVDCNETAERFAQARKQLQRLIHADELRTTAIAVVINLRRTRNSDVKYEDLVRRFISQTRHTHIWIIFLIYFLE